MEHKVAGHTVNICSSPVLKRIAEIFCGIAV
jgi:hypothetical protein